MESIILFGASTLGEKAFQKMKKDYKIEFFCDNDSKKWGQIFNGKKVIKPLDLLKYKDYKIVITSSYIYAIGEQLDNMNIHSYYVYVNVDKDNYTLKKITNQSFHDLIGKNEVFFISPHEINDEAKQVFHNFYDLGTIKDGDWDQVVGTVAERDFYKSFIEQINKKAAWENTSYFHRVMDEINSGKIKWGCKNKEEFLKKCREWNQIYNDMKNNGWKQNSDYVTINIGRKGNILFNDGLHRLVFAKLLNINKMPVKVVVRHKEWLDFKKQIKLYADLHEGKIYAPINHFDLRHFECFHKGRFDKIIENISKKSKTVLDIGAHWGFFDSILEDEGKICTAVEILEQNIYFMQKIKEANKQNFRIINEDIFQFVEKEHNFDTVLALNIFHHFLKTKELYNKLVNLLLKLEMEEMFFEANNYNEPQMKSSFINYHPEEFVKFIIQNSCLNYYKKIGEFDGRELYHITK